MKIIITLILSGILIFSISLADSKTSHRFKSQQSDCEQARIARECYDIDFGNIYFDNNLSIDFDGGDLILEHSSRRYNDEIRISSVYHLFINGRRIKTDWMQTGLLKKYYINAKELTESAKMLGLEGGRIGIAGARIGMHAVGGLFKALGSDYDLEDLEDELEEQAEALEERAEALGEQADLLEEIAEDLEDISEELIENILELDELEWF